MFGNLLSIPIVVLIVVDHVTRIGTKMKTDTDPDKDRDDDQLIPASSFNHSLLPKALVRSGYLQAQPLANSLGELLQR